VTAWLASALGVSRDRALRRLARRAALAVAIALAALGAQTATAALPQQQGSVDLLSQANVQIDGAGGGNAAGTSVAPAGDVNGDGVADIVVGASTAYFGRGQQGAAHVIFGQPGPPASSSLDIAALGSRGFTIVGAADFDWAGASVAGAGDVNGDGRDDLLVGAPETDDPGIAGAKAGAAYVVFGKADTARVDLAALGQAGFRIGGALAGDHAGRSVGGAGDVNGDRIADVIVGVPGADKTGTDSGSAYVVFGKAGATAVDMSALANGGFRIDGVAAGDEAGFSVAGAKDVNGDGRPDLIVGADHADIPGRFDTGAAYVVYGKPTTNTVSLATLGASGFRMTGGSDAEFAGSAVAGTGDVNGDGLADVVVGSPLADANSRTNSGSAIVVFGRTANTTVDLGAPGSAGFRIDGAAASDQFGIAVGGAGDVNGDGRPDVVAGSRYATSNGRATAGSATVAFGKGDSVAVDAGAPGARGYRVDGAAAGDSAGAAVSGAGDFNGDGRADVVVGAAGADNNDRSNSGAAYVLFGFGPGSLGYNSIVAQRGQPIAPAPPVNVARTGVPAFSAVALPAGLTIDPASGVVTGAPTVAAPATAYTITMTDFSGVTSGLLSITVVGPTEPPPPPPVPPPPPPEPLSEPVNTRAPTITGRAIRGKRLACSRGSWTGIQPIAYATTWRRAGRTIDKGPSHKVLKADVARKLTCRVTAKNTAGSAFATSKSVTSKPDIVEIFVSGGIDPEGVPRRRACRGTMTLTLLRRGRPVARHTVKLSTACRWEWTFKVDRAKLGPARTLRLRLAFSGNGAFAPFTSLRRAPVKVPGA
jgi:hypothetical protein